MIAGALLGFLFLVRLPNLALFVGVAGALIISIGLLRLRSEPISRSVAEFLSVAAGFVLAGAIPMMLINYVNTGSTLTFTYSEGDTGNLLARLSVQYISTEFGHYFLSGRAAITNAICILAIPVLLLFGTRSSGIGSRSFVIKWSVILSSVVTFIFFIILYESYNHVYLLPQCYYNICGLLVSRPRWAYGDYRSSTSCAIFSAILVIAIAGFAASNLQRGTPRVTTEIEDAIDEITDDAIVWGHRYSSFMQYYRRIAAATLHHAPSPEIEDYFVGEVRRRGIDQFVIVENEAYSDMINRLKEMYPVEFVRMFKLPAHRRTVEIYKIPGGKD